MKKIINFLKNTSKKQRITGGVVGLIVIALIGFLVFGSGNKSEVTQEQPDQKYYSQLTGNEVTQEVSKRPILGVMVENSAAARPQIGLGSAGIIFEAVTEGGITRYLALYQEGMPEVIEPVRSVRTHFLDWLMGFDASVAHVGGSFEALNLIKQRGAKSLSQFSYSQPYHRDSARPAPHNIVANLADLAALQNKLGQTTSQFDEIPRKDSIPAETSEASKISVDFSSAIFKVEFRYDKAVNSYVRYLTGKPDIDKATGKPITVKNLIVLRAKELSSGGVKAAGEGEAYIFNDGKVQKATWKKLRFNDPLKFYDAQNNQISLLRGNAWIAALGLDKELSYK